MRFLSALVLLFAVGAGSPAVHAEDAAIDEFFGTYVGGGVAQRDDGTTEQRDMDVSIKAYKNNGFTLSWITVVRDEVGGRTGAGVKRRSVEEDFVPSPEMPGIFVSAPEGGLFSQAELANPLSGDPFRWASLRGNTLAVYSAGINPNGGTELQIYERTLTAEGLDVSFVRLADEDVKVRVDGSLIRAD